MILFRGRSSTQAFCESAPARSRTWIYRLGRRTCLTARRGARVGSIVGEQVCGTFCAGCSVHGSFHVYGPDGVNWAEDGACRGRGAADRSRLERSELEGRGSAESEPGARDRTPGA